MGAWSFVHERAAQFVPATMLITAALFAFSSVPTFLFLRERALPVAGDSGSAVYMQKRSRWLLLRRRKRLSGRQRFKLRQILMGDK